MWRSCGASSGAAGATKRAGSKPAGASVSLSECGEQAHRRIAAAAGQRLELTERKPPVDPERAGGILVQVLELAEALPFRPRAEMPYPPLAQRLRGAAT